MVIEKDKVAVLQYTLRKEGLEGEIVEVVDENQPMALLFGHNRLIPGFEEQLYGLTEGTEFSFPVTKDKGYGEADPHAFVSLPASTFEVEGKIDENLVKLGNKIPMRDNQGNRHDGYVHEITDETIVMDFNHPLAGKDIHFSGKVMQVRDALPEEITPQSGGCGSGCGCSTESSGGGCSTEGGGGCGDSSCSTEEPQGGGGCGSGCGC